MQILVSIVKKIHKAVKEKFIIDAEPLVDKPLNSDKESSFWDAVGKDGEKIFDRLIANYNPAIKSQYLAKRAIYPNLKLLKPDSPPYVAFNNDYLAVFLNYLGFQSGDLSERFSEFCLHHEVSEKEMKDQLELPGDRVKSETDESISEADLMRIREIRKELGMLMYKTTKLTNTKWWFYFHGYTKYKILQEQENVWTLVKLLLVFENIDENGELVVRIDNTSIEHYDYLGTVDFDSSRSEIIVMNLKTVPYQDRQLNVKIHVGTGEGTLFLGQYLNYEGDNHIISGNIVLERINERRELLISPAVYRISNLPDGVHEYTKDQYGISQYIIQYLHDKNKNFRRTPLRVGHDLHGLKSWLNTRKAEDNPD